MRNLRIIFMGTPEFAVTILKGIVESGYNVVGVVTAPDKPAGRGRKLQESAVKQYAVSKNLKIFQPVNLKSSDFLEELEALQPNVQVVVAFRMLPKVVWQLPEFGTFNLHASLLPQYRGAAPINWAIINGEPSTGVSTFFIDEKIDTGEMILQLGVPIEPKETAGELHDKLMETGSKLVIRTLEQIKKNTTKPEKQKEDVVLKEAPKLTKENTRIDWQASSEDIFNLVRGLSPYPTAWTYLINDNKEIPVKVYGAETEDKEHSLELGKVIEENKKLKVAVKNGFVTITEIQLPGKKKMEVKQLLNGFQIHKDAKVV